VIAGGYYIKARKAKESWIAHAAPCIREIWDYLLREANHADNGTCACGQLIRSYADIQDALHWMVGYRKKTYSKWQCEWALKQLTKERMTATARTTRGILITIVNYETYQNPANYEHHDERHYAATGTPQCRHTINKKVKNEKNERSKKDLSSEAVRLADLLAALIQNRKPDFVRKGNWAKDIDLMIRVDGRKPEDIEAVIRWCQADCAPRGKNGFCWANNILSGEKLREKYDTLDLQRQSETTHAKPRRDPELHFTSNYGITVSNEGPASVP
jgi:hypothetical protein